MYSGTVNANKDTVGDAGPSRIARGAIKANLPKQAEIKSQTLFSVFERREERIASTSPLAGEPIILIILSRRVWNTEKTSNIRSNYH